MNRCVVSVATGERFQGGLHRMVPLMDKFGHCTRRTWDNELPPGSPTHEENPYAFKLWAMSWANILLYPRVLWCDSSIVPLRDMTPLWDLIEKQGYWISRNYDYVNGMFTADSAYEALQVDRETNWTIPHVVATSWGVSFDHPTGREIYDQMMTLAQAGAFRGPHVGGSTDPRVVGHRHDQTALSVVAWRLGLILTEMPVPYAEDADNTYETILVARR